jgi:hypothetical protein
VPHGGWSLAEPPQQASQCTAAGVALQETALPLVERLHTRLLTRLKILITHIARGRLVARGRGGGVLQQPR